jgi:hypothetical protein
MGNQTIPPQRFRTILVNLLWVPGVCLMLGGVLLPVYYWLTCPNTPEPATGHVIRWSKRGASIYVTTNQQRLELGLWISGLSLFVPAYFLRRRWNMLPESLIVPDYEKIRATYNDK